ncbi:hypothetical protein [Goekera deserti]|uniref:hypothetical protein n=1 Tax=Goekera deserti TaxID=2497753 RepID=UPI00192EA8AA|nr:hypothetical protein [Goekera deserti]
MHVCGECGHRDRPHVPAVPRSTRTSVTDALVAHNARYAATSTGPLPLPPAKRVAVVACMDARIDSVRGFVFDVATGRLAEVV